MADAYVCVLFGYVCLGGDPLSSSVMIGMSCIWVFCFVLFLSRQDLFVVLAVLKLAV